MVKPEENRPAAVEWPDHDLRGIAALRLQPFRLAFGHESGH